MRAVKYAELRKLKTKHGSKWLSEHLCENLLSEEKDSLQPGDVSFTELMRAIIGDSVFQEVFTPGSKSLYYEEVSGVDSTAFTAITSTIISAKVLMAFNEEVDMASALIGVEPNTKIRNEQRPGMSNLADETLTVREQEPYTTFGFGEEYQNFPDGEKHGLIVAVTKELIFFDQTNLALNRAQAVGKAVGMNKANRIWDVVLGVTNNYNFSGNAYNTYYPRGSGAPWANIHNRALETWRDIDIAERLWDLMTDPATGEPIDIGGGKTILVMPAREATARYILNATATSQNLASVGLTAPIGVSTNDGNPVSAYTLAPASRRARNRLTVAGVMPREVADDVWILGDFKKAFVYRENWPITLSQQATGSDAEFEQDIILRFKASERGVAVVMQPREVLLSAGTCDFSSSEGTECVPPDWPFSDAYGSGGVLT